MYLVSHVCSHVWLIHDDVMYDDHLLVIHVDDMYGEHLLVIHVDVMYGEHLWVIHVDVMYDGHLWVIHVDVTWSTFFKSNLNSDEFFLFPFIVFFSCLSILFLYWLSCLFE